MSSADGETGGLPRKAFTAAFFAPLPHAQLHQRLVDAEMQVFGMAEPPHGQTAGLHSLHKRVLFFPMAAIDQSLRGWPAALAASNSHSVVDLCGRPRTGVP